MLANTVHPHKSSRTASWLAPNEQVHNQVEFILKPQHLKFSTNKANTRSFPDADTGSNHDLVLTTIKMKLITTSFMKSPHIQFHLEKCKDPKIAEVFQVKMGGKFAALYILDSEVDSLMNSLKPVKEVILSTVEEVLGKSGKKTLSWVRNKVLNQCDQRRQLRQQKYPSTKAGLEYRNVNREVRKKMKAAKEEWTEEQRNNTEKEMMAGNSKVNNTLKVFTKTQKDKSAVIKRSRLRFTCITVILIVCSYERHWAILCQRDSMKQVNSLTLAGFLENKKRRTMKPTSPISDLRFPGFVFTTFMARKVTMNTTTPTHKSLQPGSIPFCQQIS